MAKQRKAPEEVQVELFRPRYPAIEKLVDSEDFNAINAHYAQAYEELEKIAKQNGLRSSRDAKKAMKALERVMDLMKYLLKLKYQFLKAQEEGTAGEKSPQEKMTGDTQLQR